MLRHRGAEGFVGAALFGRRFDPDFKRIGGFLFQPVFLFPRVDLYFNITFHNIGTNRFFKIQNPILPTNHANWGFSLQ